MTITALNCYGQDFSPPKKLDKKIKGEFYDGQITFTSGEILKGAIQYDFESAVLYLKKDSQTLPYSSNTVVSFSFYQNGANRTFYSLLYEEDGTRQYRFFEILFEKNNVALLSNYYVTYYPRSVGYDAFGSAMPSGGPASDQKIFIVDGDAGIIPFLTKNAFSRSKKKRLGREDSFYYHMIDKTLPESVFNTHFPKIEKFRKENKLKYHKLSDLIKIAGFYATIKNESN